MSTSARNHVIARLALAALAVLCLSPQGHAIEGFHFVAEQTLQGITPVCMTSLGEDGLVLLDGQSNTLQFLDTALMPGRRIPIDSASGVRAETVSALAYDRQRAEMLVLDAKQKSVHVFDTDGDFLETIDLKLSGPGKLKNPGDLVVDGNGILYILDDDTVKVFTRQGIYLVTMQKAPNKDGKRADFKPTGLALRPDGTLAVVDMAERCIQIFMRNGTHRYRVRLEGDFTRLDHLVSGANSEYISLDTRRQRVYKWNHVGVLSTAFGAKGAGRGLFRSLAAITTDHDGRVVILDRKLSKLQSFAFDQPCHATESTTPPPYYHVRFTGELHPSRTLVAMLPEGDVSFDSSTRRLFLRAKDGEHVFADDRMNSVSTACICDGRLYAFDRNSHSIFAFRIEDGELVCRFGAGRQGGNLGEVVRMLPGEANTLFLADQDDTRIKVFSRDGIFSTGFGVKGKELEQEISHLTDMTWYRGSLAVLDGPRELIHLFDTGGRFLRNIPVPLPQGSMDLEAIDTDPNGFLVLLDRKRPRILVLDHEGKVAYQFGSRGQRVFDWKRPSGMTIRDDGTLTLVDNTNPPRVLVYTLETPDPVSQAAIATDRDDRRTVMEQLQPFLAALDTGNMEPTRTNARGAVVAVTADAKFQDVLSNLQREVAQRVLGQWLNAHPDDVESRLALAQSFHKAKQTEEAILVLQAAPQQRADARCAALLATYKDELDESGRAQAIVTIDSCEVPRLLPALSQSYYEQPVITLTVSNTGGRPTPPGIATFFAKAIMDNPTETPVPALAPFSTQTVACRATFNRNILTYVETTRLSAHVQVKFGKGRNAVAAESHAGFELQGRNSIDWKQEDMVACFVTTKDPDVQVFLRRALSAAEEQTIQADLDPHLYKALTLFDAMQSIDLYYTPDPSQPFNYSRLSGEGLVDYVQFPRETLMRQSGDCDDLAVLYAALLEGAGIPTVLVTSPGHIFVAFLLKNGKQAVDALGLDPSGLVELNGDVYVPIETSLIGNAFVTAWRVAANTIVKHQPADDIGFIDLHKAWEKYKTVSLPPHDQKIPLPTRSVLGLLLRRELDALNLKQVEKRLAVYKRWLEREPENQALLILLARSYGEVGVFDLAQEYADRAMKVAPNNQTVYQVYGNLAFMQNDCEKAIEWFQKADAMNHTAPIQVNLALTYLKAGQLVLARKAYAEAKRLDPGLVEGYPELVQLLE